VIVKLFVALLVCAILGAIGYGAFGSASGYPAPVSLDAYVNGHGVTFAPAGAHYSVRFTAEPKVAHSVAHAKGYDVATRTALVSTTEYDLLLRETTLSVTGKDRKAASKASALLSQSTMKRYLDTALRSANVANAHTISTKVSGFPALVYRGEVSPLNGSVAAAAIYARGRIFTLLVHADRNGDAVLHAFEKSLRFTAR
jgi:hypothetical protein